MSPVNGGIPVPVTMEAPRMVMKKLRDSLTGSES
jgi:hypothetical protein